MSSTQNRLTNEPVLPVPKISIYYPGSLGSTAGETPLPHVSEKINCIVIKSKTSHLAHGRNGNVFVAGHTEANLRVPTYILDHALGSLGQCS